MLNKALEKNNEVEKSKWLFLLCLLLVGLLNTLQAIFTEIGNDEAYYFLYSQNLDWGYYDHPPMVALIIKLGTLLFGQTTIGVRSVGILLHLVSLFFLFSLSEVGWSKRSVLTFFLIAESVCMYTAYGFITTPDTPLLFFCILFLYIFRKYSSSSSTDAKTVVALAIVMACTMYSKYHGAIAMGFILLLNWGVLKRPSLWLAVALAILLYLPHIIWQFQHQFLTFQYHLDGRSSGFNFGLFPEYLGNQFAVFNPFLIIPFAIISVRSSKAYHNSWWDKLMVYFWLVIAFFLLWNFKTRVEPHWTIVGAISLIPLLTRAFTTDARWRKYTLNILAPAYVLILLVRAALIWDIAPVRLEFHGGKERVSALAVYAGSRPYITQSGFQFPSRYHFYTGQDAHCIGSFDYRNTQYDFWKFDENFWDKPAVVEIDYSDTLAPITLNGREFLLYEVEKYQPYKRLQIERLNTGECETFSRGQAYTMPIRLSNPYLHTYNIIHPELPLQLYLCLIYNENGSVIKREVAIDDIKYPKLSLGSNASMDIPLTIIIPTDIPTGKMRMMIAPGTPILGAATLSLPSQVTIE